MPKATLTEEEREARQEARRVIRSFDEAATVLAGRAGHLELYAAKNAAAGRDGGELSKNKRAQKLRRVAAFLTDPRLRRALAESSELREILTGEAVGFAAQHLLAPRRISPADVKPSQPNRFRSHYVEHWPESEMESEL
jgi:hypothetical protein